MGFLVILAIKGGIKWSLGELPVGYKIEPQQSVNF